MKSLIFLFAAIVCSFISYAQAPGWQWALGGASRGNSGGRSIAIDPGGNLLLTGVFSGPSITIGATTLTNSGSANVYIAKYDSRGNPLWAQSGNGDATDNPRQVVSDPSGNVITVGYFGGDSIRFGTYLFRNDYTRGAPGSYIVKYDPTGHLLWAAHPYSTKSHLATAVATDGAGNIYVTGVFDGQFIAFGTDTVYSATTTFNADIYVVKYDPTGHVLWAKSYGGSGADDFFAIAADAAGNIFLTGATASPSINIGGTVITSPAQCVITARLDASGNTIWAKGSGPGFIVQGEAIATDGAGNAYISGAYASDSFVLGSFVLHNPNLNYYNMFVARYDTAGNITWAKSQGPADSITTGAINGAGIAADGAGNVYVSGWFKAVPRLIFGDDTLREDTAAAAQTVFVLAYDAAGNPRWAAASEGDGAYTCHAIARSDSGAIYISGDYMGAAISFGSSTVPLTDTSQSYIAKLYPAANTAVGPVHVLADGMLAYPVPVSGTLHLNLYGSGYTSVTICDMQGRVVAVYPCDAAAANASLSVNTANMPAGGYIINAAQHGITSSRKIAVK